MNVCSIGTTDPWNAAGLGLDVLALAECGARALTVVAGVTAQDRHGIAARHPVPRAIVERQFDALRDARIAAYRIGALLDVATIDAVAAHVARAPEPSVYDPVLFASGGGDFADGAMERAMRAQLVPHVRLLTPNAAEAARLTGVAACDGVEAMEAAGRALLADGAGAVLVKGGDRAGAVIDVLVERTGTTVFETPRLPGTMRGTGCLLACAAAAELGRGEATRRAVETARAFVRAKFSTARDLAGMRVAY